MSGFVKSVVLVLALALTGCTPEPKPDVSVPGGGCVEMGGQVVTGFAGPTCAMPTPDAGKSCRKASDCSGSCLGETMTCSKLAPMFGCYEVVMENGQKASLWVD